MKNTVNLSRVSSGLGRILILSAMFIFFTSCEKEDMNSSESFEQSDVKRSPQKGNQSIAALAINAGYNELVEALSYVDTAEGAGLVNLFLNGTDQYTVFAPTDSAFFRLYNSQSVGAITDLPSGLVLDVLLYHVTNGRRAANSVVPKNKPRRINTLLGVPFEVNNVGGIQAGQNTASITAADISASNGIIHEIDEVLLP